LPPGGKPTGGRDHARRGSRRILEWDVLTLIEVGHRNDQV
jgi:hypothetical protein